MAAQPDAAGVASRNVYKYLFLLIFFCTFQFSTSADAQAAASRDEPEIERWITSHAKRASSLEVVNARYRVVGDVDGDARDDVAVLYTLKKRGTSTAGEMRYLAVFVRGRRGLAPPLHALVGGPGIGEASRATILKRRVVLEMLTYARGNAACCPTRPVMRRYRLGEGRLLLERVAKSSDSSTRHSGSNATP